MCLKEIKNKSLLLACIATFLFFASASIKKPFVMDELFFVNAAIGEDPEAFITVLTHPPLYTYLVILSFKIFGVSEVSARIVGIMFYLATIILIYFLSLEIFYENKNRHLIALSGSFIYSINPFVIQNSVLTSIDSAMLPFFLTLFMLAFVKTAAMENKRLPILGILFGILLWTKFAAPLFMMLAIFVFYVLNKEYKKGIVNSAAITGIGAVFFLLTWALYSNMLNLPFWMPLEYNIGMLGYGLNRGQGFLTLLKALWGLKTISFWVTPFFFLLVIIILYQRVKNFLRTKKLICSDLLLLCSFTIVIMYSVIYPLAYGFPSYSVASIPFFSILIGELFARSDIEKIFKERYIQCLACFGIVWVYLFYVVKDPIIFPWKQEYEMFIYIYNNLLITFIRFLVYKTLIYVLPFLIFFIWFMIFRFDRSKLVVISLIFALVSTSIYLDAVQSQADYLTTYNYGETGLREAASYVGNHTNKSDFIIADFDIGYYAGRRYYIPFNFLHCRESDFTICQRQFQKIIDSNNITYIVLRSNDLWKKEVIEYVNSRYTFISRIGSFEIYANK